jgi:flagellar hook-length control protein fliK
MQRDFDEALLRARLRPDAEDEETGSPGAQLSDHPAPATLPWVEKLSSTLSQAPVAGSQTFQSEITAVSAGEAMAGTGVPAVVTQQQAITAQSITPSFPTLLQQHQGTVQPMAINGQQWQLQLPVAGATSGALDLRLTQSGAGEWQVRLHASASLRQQLQPHIGRLRQQLSQHGSHLEEDMGPEEEA